MKEDVRNHFLNVTCPQIQELHSQSPQKGPHVHAGDSGSTNLAKLSKYIEELVEKFSPEEVYNLNGMSTDVPFNMRLLSFAENQVCKS